MIRKSIKYYQNNKHFVSDDFLENRTELNENQELTEEHAPRLEKGQLENALQKLSERYQIILKLYYLEGYDHQEISEIMNWSYANCRTTLSRAREQLKKQII